MRGADQKDSSIQTSFQVGKYLVSPLTRATDGGFAAVVSIRSGAGSMTHDRVVRFVPIFETRDQASRYAARQALTWLGRTALEFHPGSTTQE